MNKNENKIKLASIPAILIGIFSALPHQQIHAKDLYTSSRCLVKKADNLEQLPPLGLILTWSGDCTNGYTSGPGTLIAKKSDHIIFSYEGTMVDGELSGQGSIQWPALNTSYKGEFASGRINGTGVYRYEDGGIYEGNMKDGEPEGHGKLKWPNESYEGEWKGGLINGKGIYRFADGRVYEGYMKNGIPDGQGRMSWPDTKDSYQGEWKNDKMHGRGIYRYGDGTTYEGNLKNDVFTGQGKLTWKDGSSFTGQFKNDLANGAGILRKPDGTSKEVTYINGKIKSPTINKGRALESENAKNETDNSNPGAYSLFALIIDSHTGKRGVLSIAKNLNQALDYSKESMPRGVAPSEPPIKCGPGWFGMVASNPDGSAGGSGIGIACGRQTAEEATKDALQECRKRYPACASSGQRYEVSWGRVTRDIRPGRNLSFDTYNNEGAFCNFVDGYPFGVCQKNPQLLNIVRRAGIHVDTSH